MPYGLHLRELCFVIEVRDDRAARAFPVAMRAVHVEPRARPLSQIAVRSRGIGEFRTGAFIKWLIEMAQMGEGAQFVVRGYNRLHLRRRFRLDRQTRENRMFVL